MSHDIVRKKDFIQWYCLTENFLHNNTNARIKKKPSVYLMPGWGNCYEQLEKKGCFEICQKEKGPNPALVEAGGEPSTSSHVDWQAMLHGTQRAGQELAV